MRSGTCVQPDERADVYIFLRCARAGAEPARRLQVQPISRNRVTAYCTALRLPASGDRDARSGPGRPNGFFGPRFTITIKNIPMSTARLYSSTHDS